METNINSATGRTIIRFADQPHRAVLIKTDLDNTWYVAIERKLARATGYFKPFKVLNQKEFIDGAEAEKFAVDNLSRLRRLCGIFLQS